ncbi:MAG: response regulator [Thermodesulfobacteriota bacterium]
MKSKVFIVEDDPGWCEALKHFFDQSGDFHAEAFTDARKAWESMSLSPPDLAIIDVIMPSLGGQELAEMMQEQGLKTRVIFLTGLLTPEETKARDYRVGNQTVVGKPVNLGVLMGLARKALAV